MNAETWLKQQLPVGLRSSGVGSQGAMRLKQIPESSFCFCSSALPLRLLLKESLRISVANL